MPTDQLQEFFENANLYEDVQIHFNYNTGNEKYHHPLDFFEKTFQYYCEVDQRVTTFQLDVERSHRTNPIPEEFLKKGYLNYTFFCRAECRACNEYHVSLMLNVYSDKPISNWVGSLGMDDPRANIERFEDAGIWIKKVGINPPIKVHIDKEVSKHLSRVAQTWLYKAKVLMTQSFGIGAFAYLRRIIESELIKIIEEISELPDADQMAIKSLLQEYSQRAETNTIYNNIYEFLPSSLKSLGDNPFKLLYNQTSEGLHSLSDSDCFARSQNIIKILEFTLRKINEEKSEIKDVKSAIQALRLGKENH